MRTLFFALLALVFGAGPGFASDRVLILSAESDRLAVLDAATLETVAEPAVGPGALAAARIFDPSTGRVKTYVLRRASVVVLDDRFEAAAEIELPAAPVEPGPALAVARDAGRVAVATRRGVFLIDTAHDTVATVVELEADAIAAGPRYVYALDSGAVVRRIDPSEARVLDGGLPAAPGTTLSAAPDGSQVYAAGERSLLELTELTDSAFVAGAQTRRHAPAARGASVAGGRGARALWALDSALQVSSPAPGGRLETLTPLRGVTAFALSRDGETAYVAEGVVVRALDASTGEERARASLGAAPTTVSYSPEPVEGQTQTPIITKVSGNPIVQEGSAFQLQVGGPIGGVPLTVTEFPAIVDCTPPPGGLNGLTTINCVAGDILSTTQSEVTVGAGGLGSVTFIVTVFPAGLPDGINPIGATTRSVGAGASFQLSVEYRVGGAPKPATQLAVTRGVGAAASCPDTASTNSSGIATVTCTATSPQQDVMFTIRFSDGLGAQATFTITVLGTGGAGGALIKVTPEPINVLEGDGFSLVVEARQNGLPQQGVILQVTSSSPAVQCPSQGTTGSNGRVLFACGAGQVNQSTSVTVTIREGNVRQVVYTVTVVESAADGLSIAGNNNQIVQQGTQLAAPLLVAARMNGQPQALLQLTVTTQPPNLLTCPSPVVTDQNGIASIPCSAGTVQGQTEVAVQVKDASNRMLPAPFSVTITPNAVGQAVSLEALSPLDIQAEAGSTVPRAIRVRALSEDGLPVPGAFVYFRSADPRLTFATNPVLTNANGVAEATVTFDCPVSPGSIQVGLSAQTTLLTFTYRLTGGPLSALVIDQGNNQSGNPGERLPLALAVRAEDVCGGRLPGVGVSWAVEPLGAASLEATVGVTDSRGRSSTLVRISPTRFDPFAVIARTGTLSATFQVDVANAPANLAATSGAGQQIPARSTAAQPLVATVTNASGLLVAGVTVLFEVVTGDATLANPSTTTNQQGRATALVQAGSALGPLMVEARAIGQTVSYALTVIGGLPAVTLDSFTNGGSFRAGWTPGSAGSIFGTDMMEGVVGVEPTPFPFPMRYRGVEVRVNGVSAPLFALIDQNGAQQINLQVPFGLAPGLATVEIRNNGSSRTVTGVPINRVQPGIFEVFVEGERFAAALHADFTLVTPSNPARPNEVILLFLTGVGLTDQPLQTNVPGPANPLASVRGQVVVGLENQGQSTLGAFYAPGLISVYQINFRVMSSAPSGNLRLNVRVDDAFSQVVSLPVLR